MAQYFGRRGTIQCILDSDPASNTGPFGTRWIPQACPLWISAEFRFSLYKIPEMDCLCDRGNCIHSRTHPFTSFTSPVPFIPSLNTQPFAIYYSGFYCLENLVHPSHPPLSTKHHAFQRWASPIRLSSSRQLSRNFGPSSI